MRGKRGLCGGLMGATNTTRRSLVPHLLDIIRSFARGVARGDQALRMGRTCRPG